MFVSSSIAALIAAGTVLSATPPGFEPASSEDLQVFFCDNVATDGVEIQQDELEMAPVLGTAEHLYGEYAVIMVDTTPSLSGCRAGNTLQYLQTGLRSSNTVSRIAFQDMMELEYSDNKMPAAPFIKPSSTSSQQYVTLLLNTTGCGMGISALEMAATRREDFDVAKVVELSGASVVAASYFSSKGSGSSAISKDSKKAQSPFQKRNAAITILNHPSGLSSLTPAPTQLLPGQQQQQQPQNPPPITVTIPPVGQPVGQPLQTLTPLPGGAAPQPLPQNPAPVVAPPVPAPVQGGQAQPTGTLPAIIQRPAAGAQNQQTATPLQSNLPIFQQPNQPIVQQPGQPIQQQPGQPINRQPGQPILQQPGQPIQQQPGQPIFQQPGQPVQQQPGQPIQQQPGQQLPGQQVGGNLPPIILTGLPTNRQGGIASPTGGNGVPGLIRTPITSFTTPFVANPTGIVPVQSGGIVPGAGGGNLPPILRPINGGQNGALPSNGVIQPGNGLLPTDANGVTQTAPFPGQQTQPNGLPLVTNAAVPLRIGRVGGYAWGGLSALVAALLF